MTKGLVSLRGTKNEAAFAQGGLRLSKERGIWAAFYNKNNEKLYCSNITGLNRKHDFII